MKQLLMYCSLSLLALGVASIAPAAEGATNQVNTDGFRDTPIIPGTKWHLHDPDRPQPLVVTPGSTFSQGAPAPSDAEVLFDGKDLAKWQNNRVVESPRWNEQGELVKKACITVLYNGVVVQNHYELSGCTDGIGGVPWRSLGNYERRHSPEVFVELQDHNNPVRYRNIWIRKLGNPDNP